MTTTTHHNKLDNEKEEKEENTKEVTLKIHRSIPSKGIEPAVATYTIPVTKGMTVLDALRYVKMDIDHSIAFRYSCRMGNCGSCSVIANNKPILACQTQLADLNSGEIELRPLENFPVIRDLTSSFNEFNNKHRQIKPYIITPRNKEKTEKQTHSTEHLQSPEQLEQYIQFAHCIKSGLCFHACPITSTNTQFLGPHALSQAYRYIIDNRDQDTQHIRLETVDTKNGCWSCHLIGECSYSCPKGVDPALGIQLLRRKATAQKLGITK